MLRLFILISFFPMLVSGQANAPLTVEEQTKAYCQVFAEYIKAAAENCKFRFDTLFVGKHEEFPDIQLPPVIQGKKIILFTDKKGGKEPQHNKSFIFINIIELKSTKDKAKFMLVTFYKDYHPQHNCYITLKYNSSQKEFEPDEKIRFEYAYPKDK
ncbi:MAG: hypothetical protein ACXVP0_14910 [Bacteroidia bacterium]